MTDTKASIAETLRALRARLPDLSADEVFALTAGEQVFHRMGEGTEMVIRTILASKTKKGMVEITWGAEPPTQMAVGKARETAWMIIEAAAAAEQDELVATFLMQELDMEPQRAYQLIGALRVFRDDAQSLGGHDLDAPAPEKAPS